MTTEPYRVRTPLGPRLARGALSLLLYVAMAGGIATAVGSGLAYWRGRAAGVAAAEQAAAAEISELERRHRAESDKLRGDAQARFDAALAEAAQRNDTIDTARKEAQRALATEQTNVRRLRGERDAARADADRVRADAGQLRLALAAAASGGVTESEDTAGACRARSDALGRVLGDALQAHRACVLDAEDLAAGVRALRAWAAGIERAEVKEAK